MNVLENMDEAACKVSDDLISRKVLKEEIESLIMTITGMRNGKITTDKALEEYKKSILKIIDEQPCYSKDTNVSVNDGWIPVSERLTEEGKEVLAQFTVRVRRMDNQVDKAVYIFPLNYKGGIWRNFKNGVPNGKVEYWQPLPAPYKGELNPKDIPHTCDTCRRYGKSDHNCYYCRHKERPDLWETKEKAHE